MSNDAPYTPTPADLEGAHARFLKQEPRDVFYRCALELIRLAKEGATEITPTDALAGLLQTWNREFYRFRPQLLRTLPDDLDRLLNEHRPTLDGFRDRLIDDELMAGE